MPVVRLAGPLMTLIALALAMGPVQAQEPPVFGTDVRLVAVPVFVTDKDGRAVSGLTGQDFEIEDGGHIVPVAGFLAVDAATPTQDPATSRRLVAAARRQFLLLFDLTFSNPAGILKARKAAVQLIEKGPQPGDLIAVASVGSTGVKVLLGFSSDRAQAARAVATLGSGEGQRLRDPLGLAYDLGYVPQDGGAAFGLDFNAGMSSEDFRDQVLMLSRADRAQYSQKVARYLDEMQRFAQLLDSVDGRKQVILLSGGFDQSVLLGASSAERANNASAVAQGRISEVRSDSHFGDATARSVMDGVFGALTRSDTVIHTVDVGGLAGGGATPDEAGVVPKGSGRESLAELAGRSGGRFVRDTNDIAGALRQVLEASRYYYVLAFEPADSKKKPGELHKLKIKVKRPNLELSHRTAYTLPDPKTAPAVPSAATQFQAAEAIAKGLSGGALRLQAIAVPYHDPKGRVSLSVVLEIDGQSLTAGVVGKKPLPLEIYGYALDENGRIQDAMGLTPTLDMDKLGASIRQKGVQVLTAFRVREGTADLRFLVRDPASSRVGSLRMAAVVPSFEAGALVLSPPLLMDDPRARLVIPMPSKANPDLQIPFRLEDTPFTAQPSPVLRNGEVRQVCLLAFGGAADVDLSSVVKATLVREGGDALTLEVGAPHLVKDVDRYRRLVLSLTPKGVPAGDYRLRLNVPGAGAESQSEVAVRVN